MQRIAQASSRLLQKVIKNFEPGALVEAADHRVEVAELITVVVESFVLTGITSDDQWSS